MNYKLEWTETKYTRGFYKIVETTEAVDYDKMIYVTFEEALIVKNNFKLVVG